MLGRISGMIDVQILLENCFVHTSSGRGEITRVIRAVAFSGVRTAPSCDLLYRAY